MFKLVEIILNAAKKYNIIDYGFFKFLMISFGILLGVYYTEIMLNFISLIWIVFIVSAFWMIYKIYIYTK